MMFEKYNVNFIKKSLFEDGKTLGDIFNLPELAIFWLLILFPLIFLVSIMSMPKAIILWIISFVFNVLANHFIDWE